MDYVPDILMLNGALDRGALYLHTFSSSRLKFWLLLSEFKKILKGSKFAIWKLNYYSLLMTQLPFHQIWTPPECYLNNLMISRKSRVWNWIFSKTEAIWIASLQSWVNEPLGIQWKMFQISWYFLSPMMSSYSLGKL